MFLFHSFDHWLSDSESVEELLAEDKRGQALVLAGPYDDCFENRLKTGRRKEAS